MNKRVTRKRMLVLLLTLTMVLSCMNVGGYSKSSGVANAQELATATDSKASVEEAGGNEEKFRYENTYSSDNFDVKFKLDNVWDAGYNATITITNTSDSVIENWCLTFPLNEAISNIWNAIISKEHEDFYVIKNAGWNQDIAVGGSVSFGITVYEPFTEYPEYYTILGNEVETKSEDYTVDYKITEDWGEGYKAEVTITNNKDTAIEDWRLSFEYGDNLITQIWNAVSVDNIEGKYEISCENYNQNIAPGGSVSFGFMVEPGCSGNMMENIKLTEVETELSDGIAILFGYMDEGSNEPVLSTMASVETERYEFYMSFDGGDFVKVGETTENEFTYAFENTFEKVEIYAVGYDTYGLPAETNHIFVECTDGVYTVILPDTDGDGLEDVYEIYYGSDVELVDTDSDQLNDYYEVYISSTYPTLKDSDENGILDCDEDYDKDGLSILEECNQGTDPLNPDTDYDNLLDGEEINEYGTNPLVADVDEDGLVDGDEIAVGTEPLNPDTDGDGILDGVERFVQTYTYEVENQDCAVKEISIILEGTGNLQSTTYIESVMNKDALCTGVVGLVGEPFSIETTSEFDNATITFKMDEALLGDTEFENLMFLWYNEEEPAFVELETILDKENMTASVNTTHFSKYMLVDKTAWQEAWATELNYKADNGIDTYYTVLTIDCSGSMEWNDPIINNTNINSAYDAIYNRKTCNRIEGALEFVDSMGENDKLALVYFDSNVFYTMDFTSDKDEIRRALQDIKKGEGTNYDNAIRASIDLFDQEILDSENICTRIIFLSDGEDKCSVKLLLEANMADIIIHGIGLGNDFDDSELRKMSTATGGDYYQADSSEMLLKLYETIYLYDQFDKTDADDDGLYDIFETAGIRLINGEVIYSDPALRDTDGDELWDGEEVIPEVRKADNFFYEEIYGRSNYYLDIVSYPNLEDSDWDGLNDNLPKYANGRISVPADSDPLYKNGSYAVWNAKYEYEYANIVPRKLEGYRTAGTELKDYYTNIYGSIYLDFYVDEGGNVLHTKKKQWQKEYGYMNLFDGIFFVGTGGNMSKYKIQFDYYGDDYIIWMWKGDYPNLGSGAEIGFYKDKNCIGNWDSIDFTLPMTLNLYYLEDGVENIFAWHPLSEQWWITGFNPDYRNQKVEYMSTISSISFNNKKGLYNALKAQVLETSSHRDKIVFDDDTYTMWISW